MPARLAGPRGYSLVVCEKPDAARRVAEALAIGLPEVFEVGAVQAFRSKGGDGKVYVVCAAAGHLYGISDTVKNRRVYPAFDLEWFPLQSIDKKKRGYIAGRIKAIESLSKDAGEFVNACDYDVEGETIGHNVLRYACGGKEKSALRVKLSSLTKEEIVGAFADARPNDVGGMARAGRLRHSIDFAWGVNLSRALSESLRPGFGFRVVSIGRVQGPTLGFLVEREAQARVFVPTPYWKVGGRFKAGEAVFDARYSVAAIPTKRAADEVEAECEGREGVVSRLSQRTVRRPPPPPYDLSDLQGDAFRALGFSPSKTLQVAERLYLGAMVSYPRTSSQRLPKMDYGRLLSRIGETPQYSGHVQEIFSHGALRPAEGLRTDPAHPAIYPTGERARRALSAEEVRLYDLIVRRILSCFGTEVVSAVTDIRVSVGEHTFEAERISVVEPGWTRFAAGERQVADRSGQAPPLVEGEKVRVERVLVEERERLRPERYNQATLLETMEREGIGTKATRADVISTLLARGYVKGDRLAPTELGFSLVEAMREYCPRIVSTSLTREVELELEKVSSDMAGASDVEEMLTALSDQIADVRRHEEDIAWIVGRSASPSAMIGRTGLGQCPVCKEGKLEVIHSRKSGKRFVGCSRYPDGCRASAPLPQRGTIIPSSRPCTGCGWPVVQVKMGRRGWRLCVNDRCPRKVNVYAMRVGVRRRGRQPGKGFRGTSKQV